MEINPGRVATPTSELTKLGFAVRQSGDGRLDAGAEEVILVWGNPVWFPQAMRSLRDRQAERRPLTVIWHVEPLPPPRASGYRWPLPEPREIAKILLRDTRASDIYSNYWTLKRLARFGLPDILAVVSAERTAFLAERGIEAVLVPYGYEVADGRDLGFQRDIDALFIGLPATPSRRRALNRVRRAGIRLEVAGDYFDSALWGENRTKLVNRAKIMLSISRFPTAFAIKRFLLGMACNALIVSDPVYDPQPFVRDVHFVEAPVEQLPEVIERYLADDEQRTRIAQAGHDFATREVTMEGSFRQLLEIVAERLAAR